MHVNWKQESQTARLWDDDMDSCWISCRSTATYNYTQIQPQHYAYICTYVHHTVIYVLYATYSNIEQTENFLQKLIRMAKIILYTERMIIIKKVNGLTHGWSDKLLLWVVRSWVIGLYWLLPTSCRTCSNNFGSCLFLGFNACWRGQAVVATSLLVFPQCKKCVLMWARINVLIVILIYCTFMIWYTFDCINMWLP